MQTTTNERRFGMDEKPSNRMVAPGAAALSANPLGRVRSYCATVLLCAAVALLLQQLNTHYEVGDWLVLRYLGYWSVALAFMGSVTLLGFGVMTRVGGAAFPLSERLVFATPIGLLCFELSWSIFGVAHLFNQPTFFIAPALCLVVGAVLSRRALRKIYAHRRSLRALRRPMTLLGYLVSAGGVLGLVFVYAPIVLPDNVAFDARWYHLAISEHFAAAERFTGFPEGWVLGGNPLFATLVYTWAFCMPGSTLYDRIELCAHLEFFVFCATILALPVAVRRLLPGMRGRYGTTWAGIFLFPGIFVYDSSLSLGADHFAALFAIPILLAFIRAWRELAVRPSTVLGLMAGAAISTKYTAFALGIIPGFGVIVRSLMLGARSLLRRTSFGWVKALPVLLGTVAVASAPWWLKNVIAFHNPLFPLATTVFPTHPFVAEAPDRLASVAPEEWKATHDWLGVKKTLLSLVNFAFVPNDWVIFHRDWPVFGPLFTLTTPLVAFIRRPGRLATVYFASYLFVLIWYWTFHQDRYLQAVMPWMAAGTVAVLVSVWQSRELLPKIPCALLVATQIAWSTDHPFYPAHAMLGDTPLRAFIELAGSGFHGRSKNVLKVYSEWQEVAKHLPKKARVLIHENQMHLGIARETVSDQLQTGISYLDDWSPERIYDLYRRLGVTHIVSNGRISKSLDSFGGDVAFFNFVTQYGAAPVQAGGHMVYEMPASRPRSNFRGRVLWVSCKGWYENGVYDVRGLSVTPRYGKVLGPSDFPPPLYPVPDQNRAREVLADVDVVVNHPGCFSLPEVATSGFIDVASRDGAEIWVRNQRSAP